MIVASPRTVEGSGGRSAVMGEPMGMVQLLASVSMELMGGAFVYESSGYEYMSCLVCFQ